MLLSHKSNILFLFLLFTTFVLFGQANLNRANKQFELSDFKEASKLYHKVLQNDPTNVTALSKLGDCYFYFNQLSTAKEYYQKAVQEPGFQYEYMLNYAQTLMGLGEYEEARKWFLLYGEGFPIIGEHYAAACSIASQRSKETSTYQVNSLSINTDKSDFAPAFFGDVLVYASNGKQRANDSNADRSKNQLLLSAKDKDGVEMSPSFLFQNKISNLYNIGPISFSGNGKWVAFTRNNFVDGVRQIPNSGHELSLYIAEVKDNGQWTNILAFPYNGSGYSTAYPSLSPDGKTLYFASNRPDGLGGFDIYFSKKEGTEWSFPTNLGAPINSSGDEITPFFTGETLYFSSNWHQGFGGFDVFRAEKSGANWSKIYHQGTGINSSRDDYGFIYDKDLNFGYLTSNRVGGKGLEDIYKVSQSAEKFLITTIDQRTNEVIAGVEIDFSSCGQKITSTNDLGQYGFQVSNGFDCEVVFRKNGYQITNKRIISTGKNGLTPIEIRMESTANKSKFVGRVIDHNTSNPLVNVKVIAQKTSNNQMDKVSSDGQGYYELVLDLNQSYQITYSKAGYSELERMVFTGKGEDKSILDVTNMFSSSVNIPSTNSQTTSNTENPTTEPSIPSPPLSNPTILQEPTIVNGYSVQIAAIPANASFDLNKYRKAGNIGQVYDRVSGTYRRIRVGVFATKSEANAAQKRLAAVGYDKCYVVNDNTSNTGASTTTPSSSSITSQANATPNIENDYFVRLGAFRSPENFNSKGLDVYGTISNYRSGDFTIMLVRAGSKIGRARVIRQKAEEKGFKGAYIVEKKDGKYIKKS